MPLGDRAFLLLLLDFIDIFPGSQPVQILHIFKHKDVLLVDTCQFVIALGQLLLASVGFGLPVAGSGSMVAEGDHLVEGNSADGDLCTLHEAVIILL